MAPRELCATEIYYHSICIMESAKLSTTSYKEEVETLFLRSLRFAHKNGYFMIFFTAIDCS
jgi:hypothetical protein